MGGKALSRDTVMDVGNYIAEGKKGVWIAKKLNISASTVSNISKLFNTSPFGNYSAIIQKYAKKLHD